MVITPNDYRRHSQFFWRFNEDCSGGPRGEDVVKPKEGLKIQIAPGKYFQYKILDLLVKIAGAKAKLKI